MCIQSASEKAGWWQSSSISIVSAVAAKESNGIKWRISWL